MRHNVTNQTLLKHIIKRLVKEAIESRVAAGSDWEKELAPAKEPCKRGEKMYLAKGDLEVTAEIAKTYPQELYKALSTIPMVLQKDLPSWLRAQHHGPSTLQAAAEDRSIEQSLRQIRGAAHAGLGAPLGAGSSRIVFNAGRNRVLKVALNDKGLGQNKAEVDMYDNAGRDPDAPVTQIFEYDSKYRWVESELATSKDVESEGDDPGPELDAAFKNATGMDFHTFMSYLGQIRHPAPWKKVAANPKGKKFGSAVFKLMKRGLEFGDIPRASSWGTVKRGGKAYPVLVDYGYTTDVREKYYGW